MTSIVTGGHPTRGTLVAAVDPAAHHVQGKLAERRFPAFLTPFRSVEDAEKALQEAGCILSVKAR